MSPESQSNPNKMEEAKSFVDKLNLNPEDGSVSNDTKSSITLGENNRYKDPKKAWEMISKQLQSDRRFSYKAICDMIDEACHRKPPQNDADCRNMGHNPNIDWGGMETEINANVSAMLTFADGSGKYISAKSDVEEFTEAACQRMERFEREDYRMFESLKLTSHYNLKHELNQAFYNSNAKGLGVIHRTRSDTYFWRSISPLNLVVSPGATIEPSTWPAYAIKVGVDIGELLRATAGKGDDGWNQSAVKKFLEKNCKNGKALVDDASSCSWDENGHVDDTTVEFNNADKVYFWDFYVREFDGSCTHHTIGVAGELNKTAEVEYLYSKTNAFRCLGESIHLFPHDVIHWEPNRPMGYGAKMLPYHDAENQFLNLVIGRILITSSLILRAEDEGSYEDLLNKVVFGDDITVLPPEMNASQVQFKSGMSDVEGIRNVMERLRKDRNTGMGGGIKLTSQSKTAKEAQIQYGEEARIANITTEHFRDDLGEFHFKRVMSYLSADVERGNDGSRERDYLLIRLATRGVPVDVLYGDNRIPNEEDEDYLLRIAPALEAGETEDPEDLWKPDSTHLPRRGIYLVDVADDAVSNKQEMMNNIVAGRELIYGRLSPGAQRNFDRMTATVIYGPRKADCWFPDHEQPDEEQQCAVWEQEMENNDLMRGDNVPVLPKHNHVEHLRVLTDRAMNVLQLAEAGQMPLDQVSNSLGAMIVHGVGSPDFNGGHLAYISQAPSPDMQQIAASFGQAWGSIVGKWKEASQQAQQSAQAEAQRQAQAQVAMSEDNLRMKAFVADEERKTQDHQSKIQRDAENHQMGLRALEVNLASQQTNQNG